MHSSSVQFDLNFRIKMLPRETKWVQNRRGRRSPRPRPPAPAAMLLIKLARTCGEALTLASRSPIHRSRHGGKGCSLRNVQGTFIGMSESHIGITSGAETATNVPYDSRNNQRTIPLATNTRPSPSTNRRRREEGGGSSKIQGYL
jgi:hypothetical protein